MSVPDARLVALDVLVRVAGGSGSDRALDGALRRGDLPDRERRLATELVYGVLRRRAAVDYRLRPHSKRPLEELDEPVLAGLRLGAYQIVFLDRIPAHAAVDATVEAVKRRRRPAAGFVNAVLRALLRAGAPDGDPDPFVDVPAWWADRWRARYGDDVARPWFEATLRPSDLVLRPHPHVLEPQALSAALAEQGIDTRPVPAAPGALRVVEGNPLASPLLAEGAFAVRGAASQIVASLLPVGADDVVLDACAGRGGKAIQIAEDGGPRLLAAVDVSEWRAVACRRAAGGAGVRQLHALVADLTAGAPLRGSFSRILVDAPCSGLGTVRRRPELKWRNTPERLERLAGLQLAILDSAADTLAADGLLLYATCSTEPEENEQVIEALQARRPDLRARPVCLPAGVDAGLVGDDGYFRTYPHRPDLDGFFAALLHKSA